jgi:16S rRNA (cytidine1402-2'-O)-methyltransferase
VSAPAGTLYLVATPIGNLEDITLRAIRVLREAAVVACEDTRRTRGLLAHLDIHTPTVSLHEHNEAARIPEILGMLREGKSVAVTSDAGTPAVSDPGAALVAAAASAGFRVEPIPGPSAVTAAMSVAGFPAGTFAFVGFPPRRRSQRVRFLSALSALPVAIVMFEAPHRVRDTLADLETVFAGRRMLLARELTKVYEEILRGTPAEVNASLAETPRGEVTLVIEGASEPSITDTDSKTTAPPLSPKAFVSRLRAEGVSRRDAARALAAAYGIPSREAYRLALEES